MINTIIVENEKQHSEYITSLLSKHFPEISVIAVCDSVPAGVEKIKSLRPQLVFLDVELPPYTGFDLLEQTRQTNFEVIFTTSFNQYAAKAFRFCALDFIEKPFGVDDLREAINRFKNISENGSKVNIEALLHNVKQSDASMQKVGIPVLGGLDFITLSEIILCKALDNCTDFYLTAKRKITATKTLKWVSELMQEHLFPVFATAVFNRLKGKLGLSLFSEVGVRVNFGYVYQRKEKQIRKYQHTDNIQNK